MLIIIILYSTDNTSINEINNTKNNNNVYKNIKSNFDVLNTYKISNKNYRRSNSTSINYNDDYLNNKKGSINQERRDLKKMNEDYKRSYSFDNKNDEYQYPKENKKLNYKKLIKYGSIEPIDLLSDQVQQYFKKLNQQDNMLLNILLNVIYVIADTFSCVKKITSIGKFSNPSYFYDLYYQISLCNDNIHISKKQTVNNSFIACSNVTESITYIYQLQNFLNPQYGYNKETYTPPLNNSYTIDITELYNLYRNSLIQLSHDIMYAVSKGKDIKYDIAIPCFKFLEAFITSLISGNNINELDVTAQNNNSSNILIRNELNDSIERVIQSLWFIIIYHESEISKQNYKVQNEIINKFNELYNKFKDKKEQINDKHDIRIMSELHKLIIDLKYITSKSNIISTKNACSNNKDIINNSLSNINGVLYNFYDIYKKCNAYEYDAMHNCDHDYLINIYIAQENKKYKDEIKLFKQTYDKLCKKLLFNNSDTEADDIIMPDDIIIPDDMKNINYVGELKQRKKELDKLDIKDILNKKDIKGILNKNKNINKI